MTNTLLVTVIYNISIYMAHIAQCLCLRVISESFSMDGHSLARHDIINDCGGYLGTAEETINNTPKCPSFPGRKQELFTSVVKT